jgi:hypothetical protein
MNEIAARNVEKKVVCEKNVYCKPNLMVLGTVSKLTQGASPAGTADANIMFMM